MTDSGREQVLGRVRMALGRPGPAATEPAAVTDRVTRPQPNTVPMRGRLQQPELTALFVTMAEQALATVAQVPDPAAIPGAVAAFCSGLGLPATAVLSATSPLAKLDWATAGVAVEQRLARSGDPVALATAAAGIAETGTLALLSGPDNPVTANFLPENHLVVVHERDLVGASEDLWVMLRERGTALPRTVNWITGPSRSGDIEMTMLMGAHGPVRLHILVLESGDLHA